MCGCNAECEIIRCPGCPATDWSAFTFQWTAPASPSFLQPSGSVLKRFYYANDNAMTYPGQCKCLWIVDGGDQGQSTDGVLNPVSHVYPIPSIGALQYTRVGTLPVWKISLSRWFANWSWLSADVRYYGNGWGWSPNWAGDECDQTYGNPFWGGFGGAGYNGWGWGYGGVAGYNLYYGETGNVWNVTYSLPDGVTMDCTGDTVRFFLDDQPTNVNFDADSWPEYIDIARVQK